VQCVLIARRRLDVPKLKPVVLKAFFPIWFLSSPENAVGGVADCVARDARQQPMPLRTLQYFVHVQALHAQGVVDRCVCAVCVCVCVDVSDCVRSIVRDAHVLNVDDENAEQQQQVVPPAVAQ
jgi:hypothetical protein